MRKILIVLGLAGVAAAVAKKLADKKPGPVWHTPDTDAEPVVRAVPDESPGPVADDAAGAAPDEAAADALEEPHVPTTPDAPAEQVDLEKG
jgi:hypothetical protein